MLTLGVATLVCLGLVDAISHQLPTPDQHYFKHDKTSGDKGYDLFDSFHKKDGDSYGFEKRSVFGNGGRGKDKDGGGSYHRSSLYDSGNHKPKSVSYHYESKHGKPRDYTNYDPETYEGDFLGLAAPQHKSKPFFIDEFSKPVKDESFQSLGGEKEDPSTSNRGRKYGTIDSQSGEQDPEFGFYDDGDIDGSFEGEFFSGEAASSFETDDSGENDASFY